MRSLPSRPTARGVAALCALTLGLSLAAQPASPKGPPPDGGRRGPPPAPNLPPLPDFVPAELFAVPDGFEVTLWARTPLFRNPTNMDVDAQGRIWIAEGANYRRHKDRITAGDRIVWLADTDGDGQADKSEIFVQEAQFLAPLGVAVIDNQVIVSHPPDLIVYTDVNRDGKFDPRVDKRDVLLTGFQGQNHDHSLHSVTFGPDGKWYFNQGNTGAMITDRSGRTFRLGGTYDGRGSGATPMFSWKPQDIAGAPSDDGHVYNAGAAMRVNPDGTQLEVIGHGFRNSYEQTVTSFGDVFQNDNDDPPACRTTFLMEYGDLGFFSKDGSRMWNADRRPGQSIPVAEWRQDDPGHIPAGDVYGGGSPTGIAFFEGDHFGEKWRGLLLSCEPGRNVVFGYFPQPDGAGYKLERFDFVTTNKEKDFQGTDFKGGARSITGETKTLFRPSDVVVGADGAIYVADWFDPRVGGHQDLDEKMNGAIYRIAPKGYQGIAPKFDLATTEGQLGALRSPAVNVRAQGFLRLRAQGAKAVPAVVALLGDQNPYLRARGVFLLAQMGPEGVAKTESELRAADPLQRIAAYRALRRAGKPILAHAKALAADPSPAVRREVALSLRDVPLDNARDVLLTLAQGYDGKDRAYLEAWGTGCTGKEKEIFAALAATNPAKDPLKWSAAYAGLVWRLTPAAAAADFAQRAAASSLAVADRLAATTALGLTPTKTAAFALLDLAKNSDGLVKSNAFWWVLNYKDSRWSDLGLDAELKNRGIYDADKVELTAAVVPPAPPTQLNVQAIAALTGDAKRGAALAQACQLCHRIGDAGIEYAPNLTGFASRQTTEVVIGAIVNPSSDIAHGYEGTEITLRDGTIINGLVQSSGNPLIVQSTGGTTQFIPTAKIRSRQRMERSLMLSADQLGLKSQDVADIVAFLKTQ
ncbi:MAG: c-type cytochrome [Verrucomicrobia bacterium]|nr:c-type cytochrome [Verrucomicrobiota bacterium]